MNEQKETTNGRTTIGTMTKLTHIDKRETDDNRHKAQAAAALKI